MVDCNRSVGSTVCGRCRSALAGEMLESLPTKKVGGSASLGEHERALGGWQAELVTFPELVDANGSALDALERIAAGLVVNAERMRANLDALQGLQRPRARRRRSPSPSTETSPSPRGRSWPASSTRSSRSRRSSQAQLAERLGVQQPLISKLEGGGTKDVKLSTLVKVAAALGARIRITFEKDDAVSKAATRAQSASPAIADGAKRAKRRADGGVAAPAFPDF